MHSYLLLIALAADFNVAIQNVTIVAGTNISTVNIPVTNDTIVEGDETFTMSLSVPSLLGPEITTGTIARATVTIIDTSGELNRCDYRNMQ